jgi:hypothetical protein
MNEAFSFEVMRKKYLKIKRQNFKLCDFLEKFNLKLDISSKTNFFYFFNNYLKKAFSIYYQL